MSEASTTQLTRGHRLEPRAAFRDGGGGLDGSVLRADLLCQLTAGEVEELEIRQGRELLRLGELFEVRACDEPGTLRVPGSRRWRELGAGMRAGRLVVEGHGGDLAGRGLGGGEIEIHGDAGHHLGSALEDGRIRVTGSAGHRVGAPRDGETRGQRGGVIVIDGSCGDEAGLAMRRGLLAVRGTTGLAPGHGLLAGTIFIGRGRPPACGLGMVRGTILLGEALEETESVRDWPGVHARAVGRFTPLALTLLYRWIHREGILGENPLHAATAPHLLHSADHLAGRPGRPRGKGEIIARLAMGLTAR